MKTSILAIVISLFTFEILGRQFGETEITTEEGIEVFQNEKYYLLKKNVQIEADTFFLSGDIVKIYFEKDLYDIKVIDANGNVNLDSPQYDIKASGESILFTVNDEEIYIRGINSKLLTKDTNMFSDGEIKVSNISGDFIVKGNNSSLTSENIFIEGNNIDGTFNTVDNVKEIVFLNVIDEDISYIKNEDTEMFAKKINYDESTSLMELEENVKIIRDGETVTGDYGTLDTNTNSYKVKSDDSKKVKVIILNKDE